MAIPFPVPRFSLSSVKFDYSSTRLYLVAQLVKKSPTMQEIQVGFLSQEDPLEKG